MKYRTKYFHWMEQMGLFEQLLIMGVPHFGTLDSEVHHTWSDRGYRLIQKELKCWKIKEL